MSDARVILDTIPDFSDWTKAASWVELVCALAAQVDAETVGEGAFIDVALPQVGLFQGTFGPYGSPDWRKLALAVFAADWACYQTPDDRADFGRLLGVLQAFPQGFRTWWVRAPDGSSWIPVGYTGWYPVARATFTLLRDHPAEIDSRGVMTPLRAVRYPAYVYLFNYSIIAALRRTPFSKRLLLGLVDDVKQQNALEGLCAITVSDDGERVARRFGMIRTGSVTIDGFTEGAFTMAMPTQAQ